MTRQTWTALVTAVLFIGLAAVVALVPIPFVTWHPGRTVDVYQSSGRPVIEVAGARTFPTTGELRLTTVSTTRVDSSLSLPEGVIAYVLPHRDTMPRAAIHQPGKSAEEVRAEEQRMMDTSQQDAVVAALREADVEVTERPAVSSVTVDGPADGRLELGDLFLEVNGNPVGTPNDVVAAVQDVEVGAVVAFTVLRQGSEHNVTVTTTASNTDPRVPVIGVGVQVGYQYAPQVSIVIDSRIGGPSAGMIFAIGIYDVLTPGDLLNANKVAGTGTITADGQVGSIGGVQEKLRAAEESGVTMFMVPRANCKDLEGVRTQITVAAVDDLAGAVEVLELYASEGPDAVLPTC